MKKTLLGFVFSLIIILGGSIASADEYLTEGYFAYSGTNNKATIMGFASDAAEIEYEQLYGETITIPEKIGGYEVVEIGVEAFRHTLFLTEVKLPASVTTIGKSAFWDCYNLEKINLENVEIIGVTSFNCCKRLEKVNLENVKIINDGAFSETSLKEVILPEDIEVIGAGSFSFCDIKELVIPEGKTVGESAFCYCEELEKLIIGDNCTLGTWAFEHTSGLKSVDIGKNCVIGEDAFAASGAETIIIGDGAEIREFAFSSCEVKKIDLGMAASLGANAFHYCENIKEITIPGSIEEIPEDCFEYCGGLEKIVISEGVKRIGMHAFSGDPIYGSSLKEIYLPASIENMELWAFPVNSTSPVWIFYTGTLGEWKELDWWPDYECLVVNWRPIDPSYVPESANDITIIGKGTAYGRFLIKKVNNTPAKNMEVEYSINGGPVKKTQTDENGIAYITIEDIRESADYEIMFTGTPIQTTKGIMKVTVEPLKFKSEYEATITGGVNLGLGFGVEGSVGELEAEAMLAEVGSSVEKEKGISFTQEYDGDKVSLTITSKQNIELASEAKAGLFAGVNLSGHAGVDISVGEVGVNGKTGQTFSAGYEDSDFNVDDESDIEEMSRVVAAALLENFSHNLAVQYVLDKIDAPVNVTEKGSSITLGAGIQLGVFEVGSENSDLSSEAVIASKTGSVVSENSTTSLPDGSIEYKSRAATEKGLSFGEVKFKVKKDKASYAAGLDMFGGKAKNAMSVSAAKGRTGYLNRLSFATEMVEDDSILFFDDTTTRKYCITYEDAAARAVANDYSVLYNFTNGAKAHFGQEDIEKVSNTMVYSGEPGTYSVKKEKKHGLNLDLSGSIGLGLKIGGSFGVSGIERYEFEEYSGVYENNSAYIHAYNDIEEEVKSKLITAKQVLGFVEDKISVILEEYWEIAEECVDEAKETVISVGNAAIKKTKDAANGLYVSITTPAEEKRTRSLMALSYDDYEEENYYGEAVGKPYVVGVRTEEGTEVTDFSETPFLLTIDYTEDMLAEANAYPEALCILYWDDEKQAYVNMGGELDTENSSASLEITKPGQYVLAFDSYEPQISEADVKMNKDGAIIEAVINDFGGVEEILLYIGDEEVLNKNNFEKYYNAATGKFRYKSDAFEKDHYYNVQLVAKDAMGNEAYYEDAVYIESKTYQITAVTTLSDVIGQEQEFSVSLSDENYQAESVYLTVEISDIYDNNTTCSFYAEADYETGTYTAKLPKVENGSRVTVWATVCDRFGYFESSQKQSCVVVDNIEKEDVIVVSNVSEEGVTVAFYGDHNITDCKMVLATYRDNGVLESIDVLPADRLVTFEKKAKNGTYKAYLWDGAGPVCEDAVNAKYDTLF